jgi:putative tricarboxylic transport membrane protein
MADRAIFVCTLVLAAVYIYATEQLPSLDIGDPLGPKAFPRLLGAGLVVSAIMLFFEMLRARKSAPAPAASPAEQSADRKSMLIVAAAALWTLLYFFVFEALGYVIATTLYLFPLMSFFNRGKWAANALTAVLFCVSSYVLFNHLLGVNLARGVLPF